MIFLLNHCHSKGEKSMRENHGAKHLKIWFFCMISPTLKSGSHLPKKLCYLRGWKPFKNDEKCFYFISKAFFVLKIFKILSRHFGHRKNSLIRKIRSTSKLKGHTLVYKQFQYKYCPISHNVKATRQWNLVNW